MKPAVFLDRDDTLVDTAGVGAQLRRPGDLCDPRLVKLLPGAAEAVRLLARAGLPMVVASNQGAVARGNCTEDDVRAVNRRIAELLRSAAGAEPVAWYYCPYHPDGTVQPYVREHPWRKPAPGMFLAAASELGLDLAESWSIGDKKRDAEAAISAGLPPERVFVIGGRDAAPAGAACERDVLSAAQRIAGILAERSA